MAQSSVSQLLAFGLLFVPLALRSQTATGSIVGLVADASGAAVPRTQIAVLNTLTGKRVTTVANDEGAFAATLLPVGTYQLQAEAKGFKRFQQDGIVLQVDQRANVQIRLEVGELAESVTVTADAEVVDATSSSLGKVVDNKKIAELPLNTRNAYSLVFLTPGAAGSTGNSHNQVFYSINGVRSGLMETLVDGSSAAFPTVNGFHGISVFPSVDAVQEYKVQGSNLSAEYGRSLGSVLNLVYKSGTNDFHGSAYNFLRNSVLDANNYFQNARNQPLLSFKRNQFGGVFSGPIRRNKTFFMTSYEGLRQRGFRETLTTVPTDLQRRGDFSQTLNVVGGNPVLINIADPLTTRPNPAGGFLRDLFPGNRIPADRFDPVARNTIRYWPTANQPGVAVTQQQNFYNSGSAQVDTNNFDIRIDHNLTDTQRIFGRYSYRRSFDGPPQLFPGETGAAEGRINLNDWGTNALFDYANTLNAKTVLNARLAFARNKFLFDNQGLNFLPSSLGFPASLDSVVDLPMFPRFAVGGQAALGGNDHRRSGFNNYSLVANVSQQAGKHFLKYGWEGRQLRINVWEARAAGTYNFGAAQTQGPNALAAGPATGLGFASFLLGAGSGGTLFQNWKNVASTSQYHGFYLQDDWRITRKLTLNLGLRYDFDTPRTERFDRLSWFDPNVASPLASLVPGLTGGLQFVNVGGNPRDQFLGDWNNFAPRLGFAYQANAKTVVRGAWGVIYGPSVLGAQGTVGPYGFRTENLWVATVDGVTPFNRLSNPFPQGIPPVPGSSQGLLTATGGPVEGPLTDTVVPYTIQWNFTIQRELPGNILLEAAYVGNRGRQLSRGGEGGFDLNQLDPRHLSLGAQLNLPVPNPFFGVSTAGFFQSRTISRAQSLRPFPQFTTIFPLQSSGGNSDYDSLQISFSKRYSSGVTFEGNYVFSKGLDYGTSHMNSYDIALSRSVTGLHIPHRFVFSGIYDIPVGKGRRFLGGIGRSANLILGGWQVNAIVTMQSGTPLGIGASNTIGLFTQAARANNNGRSPKLDVNARERLNRWFDTTVFTQPAPFTFGNVGTLVPTLQNHWVNNWDMSLFKQFVLSERAQGLRLQFRFEAFNAANRVRFGNPDTNVNSGAIGLVTSQANDPRQVQFGLKLLF